MRMKRFIIGVLLTCLLVGIGGPALLSWYLSRAAQEVCESCTVEWDSVRPTFSPAGVRFKGVTLVWGKPETTQIQAEIAWVRAELTRALVPRRVFITRPKVVVIEGDEKTPSSDSSLIKGDPLLIEIKNGDFIYQRVHFWEKGKTIGQVHVRKINGRISKTDSAKAKVTAVLEKTGKVNLGVVIPDIKKPTHLNISLVLRSLQLGETDAYFREVEGLSLQGNLHEGRSAVALRGNQLHAWVRARYSGLKLKFHKMEGRGGLSATLSTALSKIKIKKVKASELGPDPEKIAKLTREDESILSFIFRGLKEGAILEIGR